MSSFQVQKRVFSGFPIRELPHCTKTPGDRLELEVKTYTPKNNLQPVDGDVTIIFCHANGFPKELYEPFFGFLVDQYAALGNKIRSIWAVDMHAQGASGVLNEYKLGGQVAWFDHSRDLLSMIQTYPTEFQHPIIGMGHSMGATQIFKTAILHPTLFACLVGIDPIITSSVIVDGGADLAALSLRRRDIWPSRETAAKQFSKSLFYKTWHPKVLELLLEYGLRSLPTALYPDHDGSNYGKEAVTLTTSKHMEVFSFVPINMTSRYPGYIMFEDLPKLNPPVLYLQGGESLVNFKGENELKVKQTPGCEMIIMKDVGHLVPMEQPEDAAKLIAPFLVKSIKKWSKEIAKETEEFPVTATVPEGYMAKYPQGKKDKLMVGSKL